jgi:hypothetical protein
MEAARRARDSPPSPLFRYKRALSFWVDQRTSSSAACLLSTIVKGTIYPLWIVRRRDGEYSDVCDIRAYNTSLWRVSKPHARTR